MNIAKDNHVIAKTRQTTQANKRRRPDPKYKVGDLVYLNTKNLRLRIKKKNRSAKLYPCFVGLFLITRAEPETSNYRLELPLEYKIHLTFHTSLLKPAVANDPDQFPHREPPQPDPVFPEDNEYEIERILDHCDVWNRREYLVHWLGYPDSDDSWVKDSDMNVPELLQDYWKEVQAEIQAEEAPPRVQTTICGT